MKHTHCTSSFPRFRSRTDILSFPLTKGPGKLLSFILLVLTGLFFIGAATASSTQAASFTYFSDTTYPLAVHVLEGPDPGPTVMVQGGIQGDETAGFLTAQILSRATVNKGRLIVIPRANVPSIDIARRQVNIDLNRRFDQHYNDWYEDRLARVIRYYLAQADAFLHLHEGSGFYRPTYIDTLRNPKRYGQSVIIDTLVYDKLNLGEDVASVLKQINPSIQPPDFRFQLFNTRTFSKATSYQEMRKSLTCFALKEHSIPALAIETSKDIIQLDWKVTQQLKATVSFLSKFGVDVETETIDLQTLKKYPNARPTLTVNGQAVIPGTGRAVTLSLYEPLNIALSELPENMFSPSPAVFASDRPRENLLKTRRYPMTPFKKLVVRLDGRRVGSVPVIWKQTKLAEQAAKATAEGKPLFVLWKNNTLTLVPDGATIEANKGDRILLDGIWGQSVPEIVNVKGLVTATGGNNGQDGGKEIILDSGNFIPRYLTWDDSKTSWSCKIARETAGQKRAAFVLKVSTPKARALQLRQLAGNEALQPEMFVAWKPDGFLSLPPGDYALEGSWASVPQENLLVTVNNEPVEWGKTFSIAPDKSATLTLRLATTFEPLGTMECTPTTVAQKQQNISRIPLAEQEDEKAPTSVAAN